MKKTVHLQAVHLQAAHHRTVHLRAVHLIVQVTAQVTAVMILRVIQNQTPNPTLQVTKKRERIQK